MIPSRRDLSKDGTGQANKTAAQPRNGREHHARRAA
jgi:hypothetical protein